MGKATRIRQENARQKIAAQQAAARRAERRRQGLFFGIPVVVVIALVVGFVVFRTADSGSPAAAAKASARAAVAKQVASVPASTLNAIGPGTTYSKAVQTVSGNTATLKRDGKPAVVYVGAEYCPYCAAERWAITAALSRFGTFSGLHFIHSAPAPEVDPSTPTLTFYKSSYTSQYITFSPTEAQTVSHATLQNISAADNQLMKTYDAPPYASETGAYPFLDMGNKYVVDGASYDPAVLKGMTWAQVAAALKDPSSPVAKAVDGAANLITASVCKLTGGQPGQVCSSAAVTKVTGSI